jgi:short-subunit dehydrogenase
MPQREIAGCRTILTGASSGIGRALALELARQGARLVLNARREEPLRKLADEIAKLGGAAELVIGDITEPAVRQAALDRARSAFGGLDLLVNNAGIGALGRFEEAGPERLRQIMEVNFFALVEMARLAIPTLKQGRTPLIVNVSSILGHRAVPRSSEYCASKFAVQGFSESLRAELARLDIGVLVVSPGTTATEFFDNVVESVGKQPWPEQPGVPPEYVARETVRAIRKDRHETVPNTRGRLLLWLNRFSPRLVDWMMQRYG